MYVSMEIDWIRAWTLREPVCPTGVGLRRERFETCHPFSLVERFYADKIQLAFRNKDMPWEIV